MSRNPANILFIFYSLMLIWLQTSTHSKVHSGFFLVPGNPIRHVPGVQRLFHPCMATSVCRSIFTHHITCHHSSFCRIIICSSLLWSCLQQLFINLGFPFGLGISSHCGVWGASGPQKNYGWCSFWYFQKKY